MSLCFLICQQTRDALYKPTVRLCLPYGVTETQTARYDKEVGDVVHGGFPQPQYNQKADVKRGPSHDEGEAFDVTAGNDPDQNTADGTHGPKTHHDRAYLRHTQSTSYISLQNQVRNIIYLFSRR